MRPLAGVLCAGEGTFVLDGTPRMRERPIDDLVDGLLQVRFYPNLSSPHEMINAPTYFFTCESIYYNYTIRIIISVININR